MLVRAAVGGERVGCQATLKLRGKVGWLVLYDRASAGAIEVRQGAAAALQTAKVGRQEQDTPPPRLPY